MTPFQQFIQDLPHGQYATFRNLVKLEMLKADISMCDQTFRNWEAGTYEPDTDAKRAVIIDKDYATLDEAYKEMESVMPDSMEADDGYNISEWLEVKEKGEDDDIFLQFAAQLDDNHNLLAVLRPVR